MNKNHGYLKTAEKIAAEAGEIFQKHFGHPAEVGIKNNNPRNLVTEVDRQLERFIKQRIHRSFPDHDILGEESGLDDFQCGSGFKWFVDPIDGTTNYIQGLPMCCISISLWDSQGPLVSVVYNPILNYCFTASRGKGAFLNNKKISCSKKTRLLQAFGGFGWGRDIKKASHNFPKLIKSLNKLRTLGSAAMEMCFVALGVYDFHIQAHLSVWDFAAAVLIITEAGGLATDWQGRPPTINTKSILAANRFLHPQLLKQTKKLL